MNERKPTRHPAPENDPRPTGARQAKPSRDEREAMSQEQTDRAKHGEQCVQDGGPEPGQMC